VRHFRNIIFALAAFLWLPASAHCQLESVPGFEFLQCAADAPTSNGSTDCADSDCCAAEKAQYKSAQLRVKLPLPELLPELPVEFTFAAKLTLETLSVAGLVAARPELPHCWQFLFRTAAPPRSPSFIS
jgi:hypothetical protein